MKHCRAYGSNENHDSRETLLFRHARNYGYLTQLFHVKRIALRFETCAFKLLYLEFGNEI